MKKLICLLAVLFLINTAFAQGEAVMGIMKYPNSVKSFATGFGGVSTINSDPTGYYLNPAILGNQASENSLSVFFQPSSVKWLPKITNERIEVNVKGVNLGYNFDKMTGIPFSVGLGYINHEINYDDFYVTNKYGDVIGTYEPADSYNAFTIAFNLDYAVSLSLGLTYKSYESDNYSKDFSFDGTAIDFGILIHTSARKLMPCSSIFNFNNSKIRYNADFSIGYSKTNISDEVDTQFGKMPVPRTARLGYTFNTGVDYKLKNDAVNLFTYTFIAECSDLLIKPTYMTDGKLEYEGSMGEIDITEHLINLKWDRNVDVHVGHRFNFFETFYYSIGKFGADNIISRETSGYGISTAGLFKYLSQSNKGTSLGYIFDHLRIEYNHATIFADSHGETTYDGFTVQFINLSL